MTQNYSGNAVVTAITGAISAGDTALTLAATTGWPAAPFVATLERDTVREEQVYIGARSGANCTSVTRGYAGSTALSHASGAAIEHTADAVSFQRFEDHLDDTVGAHAATAISFTPSGGISATTVGGALAELDTEVQSAAAHVVDTTAAHLATAIEVDSTILSGTEVTVQGVLEELDAAILAGGGDISVHLADPTNAHAASAISFSPTGTVSSSTAQAAIAEVATDAASALSAGLAAVAAVPAGAVFAFGGSAAPTGYLLCDGSSQLRATYPNLFTAIGTTYGAVDGTHFTLPDLRGRMIAGRDDMGGSAASRITAAISGITATTLGATGGNQSLTGHTHTGPSHSHAVNDSGHNHEPNAIATFLVDGPTSLISLAAGGDYSPGTVTSTTTDQSGISIANGGTGATGSTGAGSSQNVPPTIVLNYIIKT